MNSEQELIDLRRKYADLNNHHKALVERVQTLEAAVNGLLITGSEYLRRIQNLEKDFDNKSMKDIAIVRSLRDGIAQVPSTPSP